ncbi:MAG: DUF294 nucleotidyltransferase-like domain-containing protein [Hyphomicrobiaceae bacterium]|nr:DUF294 nucleotidyltransferase-like domain-containing protein [Hyphomicrobiaceae bacterium]
MPTSHETGDRGAAEAALATVVPFDTLPAGDRGLVAAEAQSIDLPAGGVAIELGRRVEHVHVVLAGAVEIRSATGKIFARVRPGQTFAARAALAGGRASYLAVATEPSRVVRIPAAAVHRLETAHPGFQARFIPVGREGFEPAAIASTVASDAALSAAHVSAGGPDMMTTTARDLMTAGPIVIGMAASALEAARLMRQHDISCLPVLDGEGRLTGMLTDGDLRDRLIAEGRSSSTPVGEIMTPGPVTLAPDALAFDALVTMMTRNISHLPLTEDGALVGILTHTNLVRAQSRSAIYMIGQIHRQADTEGIAGIVRGVPELLASLVDAGSSAHKIGRIITSITDAATARLATLAEARLGPPPVAYLWAACGSQGRQEQTGTTDQDNCLVLDDAFDAAAHGAYFEALARFVCDGLNACGYVYCPGDMMATNPRWRQPVATWRGYFRGWIERPEPEAQMLASVMFDLRPIWGAEGLFPPVQREALERAGDEPRFIAHMISNALTHRPPLGLFGMLSLPRSGDHRNMIDLKMSGTAPIIDIARVHALTAGIGEVNTHRRLEEGRSTSLLGEDGARDLLAAFEFIAMTRLSHQAQQIRAGRRPDNFLAPDEIAHLELSQLKDAFAVVRDVQQAVASARPVPSR